MKTVAYSEVQGLTPGWMTLLGGLGALIAIGLGSAWYMEHNGHYVTGMSNQVVWGMPHVFAVFLIVAASGALNVASIGSVFGKTAYKPLAPLSGLLALALLVGGLMVLVLDLGRPDRLTVAMTHFNFKSIFAWNVILYTGFFAVVAVYLWMLMDRRMGGWVKPAGFAAFLWRLILTTGTGSIFGFLVARDAYNSAVMAPLFIAMSFSFGLAIFILVLMAAYRWTDRPLGDGIVRILKNLLGVFIAAVLYFVAVQHLTNLYITERHGIEAFILRDGGIYTFLFWGVQIVLGSLLPMALLFHPGLSASRANVALASLLVIVGGLAQVYVIIIGGQAYPLEIFPGMEVVASGFFDGQVAAYSPTAAETMLGISGFALAMAIVAVGATVLRFLPVSLADEG
ncbi:MAG: polysulfide reductase NrfD [Rhodospirillales bacterium]|nr:polysulfide reductase NrfD [Rhodospirillales bacterium]